MRFILFLVLIPALVFAQRNNFSSDLKIAGHRGGYYYEHPESSLPLFGSVAKKFKGDTIIVELDLRRSKNGSIYIMHDETVDRTTN